MQQYKVWAGKKFASGRAAFTSNDSGDIYIRLSQSCDFSLLK
jgi:hypothetical protein